MSPPNNTHIPSQLRQLIYYHLDNNLLRNALFLAGRLQAHEPRSPEAAYLLALCQFQSGQIKAAYETSKIHASRGTHLGCCYIYAQACLDLGRYVEGITAIQRSQNLWISRNSWNQHNEVRRQHLPDAAAVYCLQGKLWHAHKDIGKAVDCWVEALRLNPFMWDAFLGLTDAGIPVQVSNIYRMTPEMIASLSAGPTGPSSPAPDVEKLNHSTARSSTQPITSIYSTSQPQDPFFSTSNKPQGGGSALWEKFNGSKSSVVSNGLITIEDDAETPSAIDIDDISLENGENAGDRHWEPPLAPARKARSAQDIGLDFAAAPPKMRTGSIKARPRPKADSEESTVLSDAPQGVPGERKRTISGQVANASSTQVNGAEPARRSVRILNNSRPTNTAGKLSSIAGSLGLRDGRDIKRPKAPGSKTRATTSTVGRVVSGNRKNMPQPMDVDEKEHKSALPLPSTNSHVSHHRHSANERAKEAEALQYLLDLFSKLSVGYSQLARFQCQDAIQSFNSLPSGQRDTPWVLAQIGKAYYEQASYPEAEKFFIRVKTMAPSRLEDMEVYSTVLWHMKNEVELAYLAHELMEVERLSPQAVCTLGNSFSLRREHDQALKCFKRATQLDSNFAYGFTLQGHEHVANEEYDKALDAYRSAINADPRHYNAWYGLGKVYEKMGKYDFAEQHYRSAATINPTNAVLVCCIGMVLEKMKNPKAALVQYSQACALAPQSALSRFKKARVLMALQDLKAALVELKILKDIAPDEANVHFLLGRLYKMLRDKGNAIKHFTTALNLDPKVRFLHQLAPFISDTFSRLLNTSRTRWKALTNQKMMTRTTTWHEFWILSFTLLLYTIDSRQLLLPHWDLGMERRSESDLLAVRDGYSDTQFSVAFA